MGDFAELFELRPLTATRAANLSLVILLQLPLLVTRNHRNYHEGEAPLGDFTDTHESAHLDGSLLFQRFALVFYSSHSLGKGVAPELFAFRDTLHTHWRLLIVISGWPVTG